MELEVLGTGECLRLLGTAELGRIAYTERALPAVVPVSFVLHNGAIVFRAGRSGKLAAAINNAVVAFETDAVDVAARTGWSVTAVGYARVVRDATERAVLAGLGLRAWPPGEHQNYVVIAPEILEGRRIPDGRGPGLITPSVPRSPEVL
ncbi:pyridoxamine 5'-phosphate oxidase family protein [Allokutzneria sp. A3M-2-11 16]|uniref:pyridoxamine 5'-phosphate oxidase family protein n=1 Tax=Allokutzneria sp. A3M-2-11 16 TaxID=2962043 RepID=UPI0020B6B2FE|nr:pyridoxamine 5'-phosphate oxidase family protein [Allokutzneria sp. A3M-2-11 16]MCP3804480.1 pyridoxamine 5'-phosphate oxidase family protein [Allokutzneria sp. A3M-2-11 16]